MENTKMRKMMLLSAVAALILWQVGIVYYTTTNTEQQLQYRPASLDGSTARTNMNMNTTVSSAVVNLRQSHCDTVSTLSGSAGEFPRNLLFNSKNGIRQEHPLVQQNVRRYQQSMYPDWTLIEDTDESCLTKILSIDFMQPSTEGITTWYNSNTTRGAYKSDVCRLAQLWLHGGIYL
jgi:hypothetical protein